jgi:hypothetical protein
VSELNDPAAAATTGLDDPSRETVDKTGKDLPLPLGGSGGSINSPCERCPFVLLDAALDAVPAPPLDETTWRAAYRWLAEVEAGMVLRRERRMLARAVHRALHEEFHSRRYIESSGSRRSELELVKPS